ncbi:GAF domain-containing protein [Amycolatopsis sp. EV170708-02-1]|uniref:helix-turn-helix domain-containing protein n=1 Tax=Amycolatopsis sp. EV170708-02-1 TaxID=2919322 RepID=UPI001F0BAC5D|nr:GAF domain-containing protein [Amycolatopsis sp. EV170708-02-1]UMP01285.1 GAF domain-containing protein [Amycolatopsis sp. EV170708-02-1]
MRKSWLDLLLLDAAPDELQRHGGELARSRGAAAADRETAQALRLAMVLRQQAQRAAESAALNDIAIRLATLHAPDDLLPEIVDQARRLLGADLAYLGLVEDGYLRLKVTSGALTPELVGVAIPLSVGLAGEVIEHAAPRWTADYRAERRFRHDDTADTAARAESMRGLLGVPLRLRGRVLGALFVGKRQKRDFTEHEVTLASALAAHAAIAIENADAISSLNAANDQLARRTGELEQTLRWDQRLTRVVLTGGGVEGLLAEIGSMARGQVRFVAEPPDDGTADSAAVAQPVVAGERRFGALVIDGEAVRDDRLLLDRAAPALALALLAEQAAAEASRSTRAALLVELLTTTSERPTVRQAGLDPSARYSVLVVASGRARLPHLPGALTAEHGGRLLVVTTAGPDGIRRDWPHDAPTAGIAGPARGQAELRRCFHEARQTLRALEVLGRTGEAATAGQLGLYRILLDHAGRRDLAEAFEHLLGPVLAEERHRGVPLTETLRVFLDHGCRPRPAATALAIHVNTLYQRLAAVDSLLGEGWRSPQRALELHMLLHLTAASGPLDEPGGG